MSRTLRALAVLALGLALVGGTTAAAAAAVPNGIEDQNDRLLRSLQAEQPQAALALARSMERNLAPARATGIEGHYDRVLHSLQARETERTQAAVALARSAERNLAPAPASPIAAQPTARTDTAGGGTDVVASLLLGLVGGLVGAGCAIVGWIATTRRRPHRAAAV
jgi:hypothetical protein